MLKTPSNLGRHVIVGCEIKKTDLCVSKELAMVTNTLSSDVMLFVCVVGILVALPASSVYPVVGIFGGVKICGFRGW